MWWIVCCIGFALAAWGISSARRVLHPERLTFLPPDPLPAYTVHQLTADDGAAFDVWLLDAPSARARILVCHGYYANRFQVLRLADRLRQAGYEVVLLELRGHGQRSGPCTLGLKEHADAAAVLRWAQERDGARTMPVGALGWSMGAAVVCQLASNTAAVRAVVTDSAYSRFFQVLHRTIWQRFGALATPLVWVTWWTLQLRLRCRLSHLDPVSLADRLRQPLLAIHGGRDRRIDPHVGLEFYRRWSGSKEQWSDPTVGHVKMFAAHPEEYVQRVADFFDRSI